MKRYLAYKDKKFPLSSNIDEYILGRNPEGKNKIVIRKPTISRLHAKITTSTQLDTCLIKDMGSMSGTFVNGERLSPYRGEPLRNGDIISFANCVNLTFHESDELCTENLLANLLDESSKELYHNQ